VIPHGIDPGIFHPPPPLERKAFLRTGNANPQEFFPDWFFGLREDDMIKLVRNIRADENPGIADYPGELA